MTSSADRSIADAAPGDGAVAPGGDAAPDADLVRGVFARACRSRQLLQAVTGRWGVLALAALHEGPIRFNALRRRVDGVSEKMLAQTLHTLERDGLVLRDVQAAIPPRVEYRLTDLGVRVAEQMLALIELLEGSMETVLDAQRAYDQRSSGVRK